jgi:hypothetical protein
MNMISKRNSILLNIFRSSVFFVCLIRFDYVNACKVDHVADAAEITRKSDSIVIGKVIDYKQGNDSQPGQVTFEIVDVVKGPFKNRFITIQGQTEHYYGREKIQRLHGGPPYNWVRDGGIYGNCYAYDYKMDGYFLLFLKNQSPYWADLAATNEEVSGRDDPWVIWVKEHLSKQTR